MSTPTEQLIEKIQEQIDPLFEDDEGRELLLELAEYIETNMNDF